MVQKYSVLIEGLLGRYSCKEREREIEKDRVHVLSERGWQGPQQRLHVRVQHRQPKSIPCSPLSQPGLESHTYLGTDPGEGGGHAVGLRTWDLKPHNSPILRAQGLKAAVLEAGPEGAVGATEAGLVQGQDGPLITALLQGVVDLVPTHGCWLA